MQYICFQNFNYLFDFHFQADEDFQLETPKPVCSSTPQKRNIKSVKRKLINESSSCKAFQSITDRLPPELSHIIRYCDGVAYLEITRTEMDIKEQNGGPLPGARIMVSEMGTAYFQPERGDKDYADGNVIANTRLLDHLLNKLGPQWDRCNGIPLHIYEQYSTHVRYKPEHLIEDTTAN